MMPSSLRKGMIVGIGNSMLDLIGHVEEDVLDKYNLKANNNYLAKEEHMPLFNELSEKYCAKYVVGGSTQNSFRVVQWVLGEPEVSVIFGAIGCDEQSEVLVAKARGDGVDTQYQRVADVPTGICAVLLTKNGADRTLVANLSAANCFSMEHLIKPDNQERLQNADIIYVTGFLLAVNPEAILYTAKFASEQNKCFAMNLSASYLAENYMNEWAKLMPYVDILFGNDIEARTFAKQKQFSELGDVRRIAEELSILPKVNIKKGRMVVITQADDPVIVVKDGVIHEYPAIKLPPGEVVDTTGAGDAFVGGFVAQLVRGLPVEECIKCGIWCGSQMVRQKGCSLEGLVKYPGS